MQRNVSYRALGLAVQKTPELSGGHQSYLVVRVRGRREEWCTTYFWCVHQSYVIEPMHRWSSIELSSVCTRVMRYIPANTQCSRLSTKFVYWCTKQTTRVIMQGLAMAVCISVGTRFVRVVTGEL